MDVRMPDGTLVRNVPEDITQEDLLERYTAYTKPARAQPGSASYIAQGPGAVVETAGRMFTGLAGAGAGALVGGLQAAVDPTLRGVPAGDIVRERMQEGAETMTPSSTFFSPTSLFEEQAGKGFETIRELMSRGTEGIEQIRGNIAQNIHPDWGATGKTLAAAQTVGEYGFDAPAIATPYSVAKGMVRPRKILTKPPVPPVPSDISPSAKPADTSSVDVKELVESYIGKSEGKVQESKAVSYEIPDRTIPTEEVSPGDIVRRFRERGGEAEVGPVAETEMTRKAIQQFREEGAVPELPAGPGRSQAGAVGQLDKVARLEQDLQRFQDEMRDAQRREEKDTVKYFKKAIEETKSQIAELQRLYGEAPSPDPFKGPGRKQRGVIDPEVIKAPLDTFVSALARYLERLPVLRSNWQEGLRDEASAVAIVKHRLQQQMVIEGRKKPSSPVFAEAKARESLIEDITEWMAYESPREIPPLGRNLNPITLSEQGGLKQWPLSGPGKKQRGAILSRGTTPSQQRTAFEIEEDIPAGGGLALPDVKRPLKDVFYETLELGKDANLKQQTPYEVVLPNDVGRFFGKYGFQTEHASKYYGQSNPFIKSVIDRISAIDKRFAGLREDLMVGTKMLGDKAKALWPVLRYSKREPGHGFFGLIESLNKTDLLKVYDSLLDFDNMEMLAAEGRLWPTREELAAKGLNAKQIDAYFKEAEYAQASYDLINYGRSLEGIPPVPQIPGYFPHTWKGNTAIKVTRKGSEGKGTLAYNRGYASKTQRNRIAQQLIQDYREQGIDVEVEVYRTDMREEGSIAETLDAFEAVATSFADSDKPLVKLVRKTLENRIKGMEQSFLGAALQRHGVTGWIGSTGVTSKNIKSLVQARQNMIDGAINYAKSQAALKEIKQALTIHEWELLNKHLPVTFEMANAMLEVARDRIPSTLGDRAIWDAFSFVTREQFGYKMPLWSLGVLRKLYSIKDLAWSFKYHMVNGVQPWMYGFPALWREYSRIGQGNVPQAIAFAEYQMLNPNLTTKKALTWAAQNKHISPRLMEEIDIQLLPERWAGGTKKEYKILAAKVAENMLTGQRVGKLNEEFGRIQTFLMGLEYYRTAKFTEKQALEAAGKFTDDVMVNYDKSGTALWLSNNPFGQMAGKLIAPYSAFKFSHYGHMALALQAVKKNPALAHKMLPLVWMQGMGMLAAGVRGVTFMAEVIAVWSAFNWTWEQFTNEKGPLPDPWAVLASAGVNDFFLFGALSSSTKAIPGVPKGMDVGAPAGVPAYYEAVNARTAEGVYNLGKQTWEVAGKLLTNSDIPDSDKLKMWKEIAPSWLHGLFEAAYNIDEKVVADPNNRMRGGVRKDTSQTWDASALLHARPLPEAREALAKRYIHERLSKQRERKSDLIELAADYIQKHGKVNPEHIQRAKQEGYTAKQFREQVKLMIKDRHRTRLEKLTRTKENTRRRQEIRETVEELLEGYNE